MIAHHPACLPQVPALNILYLDQNKWIELARAVKSPDDYPAQYEVLAALVAESNAGGLLIPLTATNLYETQKIDIPERRNHLAWVQSTLSQGKVFRGRYKRLEVEVVDHMRSRYGLEPLPREPHWFLSNVFFESTAELGDTRIPQPSERVVDAIKSNPPRFMFDYLTGLPEDIRTMAVSKFAEGSEKLRQAIEENRARMQTNRYPSANKKLALSPAPAAIPAQKLAATAKSDSANSDSKQSRVVAMLRAPAGASIAGMMKATGWQKHSVRGFLAGVVRKRLKLKLTSEKVNGNRMYQIAGVGKAKSERRRSKTQSR